MTGIYIAHSHECKETLREWDTDMIYLGRLSVTLIRLDVIFFFFNARWDLITREDNFRLITLPLVDIHITTSSVESSLFPHVLHVCSLINQTPRLPISALCSSQTPPVIKNAAREQSGGNVTVTAGLFYNIFKWPDPKLCPWQSSITTAN